MIELEHIGVRVRKYYALWLLSLVVCVVSVVSWDWLYPVAMVLFLLGWVGGILIVSHNERRQVIAWLDELGFDEWQEDRTGANCLYRTFVTTDQTFPNKRIEQIHRYVKKVYSFYYTTITVNITVLMIFGLWLFWR